MKKTVKNALVCIMILVTVFSVVACNTVDAEGGLWENATYRCDMEFGEGETKVEVEVKVGEESVTFTLNTDKKTLGEALIEHSLIEGEDGQYGLYVKKVNGITADYNVDGSYWSFYKSGEYLLSGVDQTEISNGEHYEIVYTK